MVFVLWVLPVSHMMQAISQREIWEKIALFPEATSSDDPQMPLRLTSKKIQM